MNSPDANPPAAATAIAPDLAAADADDLQWLPEQLAAIIAQNRPALPLTRLPPPVDADAVADATALAAPIAPDDVLSVTNQVAKALCQHTTRAAGCACKGDPLACFAMSIFGDMAVAVLRGLKRGGYDLVKRP